MSQIIQDQKVKKTIDLEMVQIDVVIWQHFYLKCSDEKKDPNDVASKLIEDMLWNYINKQ